MHVDFRLRCSLSSALRAPSRIGKQTQPPVSKTRAQDLYVQTPVRKVRLRLGRSIIESSVEVTRRIFSNPGPKLDEHEVLSASPVLIVGRNRESSLGLGALRARLVLPHELSS